jgi:MFS family permease
VAFALLRHRNLRVFLAGQALNMFGDSAMIIVLGIWVKDLTGSSAAAGTIFLLLAVAGLLAPLTGLVVDRFPRRRVLMVNDLAAAALVLSLLAVHDRGDVWLVYVVALGYGVAGQVYRAARGGLVHSMVPKDLLGDVNGLFSAIGQGMRIVGPLVGAGIFAVAGGAAVAALDCATFLLSFGSYLLLRGVSDLTRGEAEGAGRLVGELVAGARHVLRTPVLRAMVLASATAFTAAGTIDVAMFELVDKGLHRPATFIGVLGTVQGAGSVVAGLRVAAVLRRFGEYGTAAAGFLLNGAGLACAPTATVPGAVTGAVMVGVGLPLVLVAEITLIQRRTGKQLQGRAIAASDAVVQVPFALSIGVAAVIIHAVGYRPIYLVDAAAFLAVGLLVLRRRGATAPDPAGGAPGTPDAEPEGTTAAT